MKILKFVFLLFAALYYGQLLNAQPVYWEKIGNFNNIYDVKSNSLGNIFISRPVRRSVDNGLSWESLNIPNANSIKNLAINDSDQIFASDEYISNNAIFKSIDNGDSWTQCNLQGGRIKALHISKEGNIYAGNNAGKFFISTDDGTTWNSSTVTDKQINCIGSCSNGQIFLGTSDDGIYSSNDYGSSWFHINNVSGDVYSVVINDSDFIFVSIFDAILISKDYGNSWQPTNLFIYTTSILGIDSSGSIYASCNGIHKSSDNGLTWNNMGGPSNITAIETFENKIYLSTLSGVFRYDPNIPFPTLLRSDYLPLHTDNLWQYMRTTATSDGNNYQITYSSVLYDTLINDKVYYKLSDWNNFIRYSKNEKKIFKYYQDSDYVFVNFNIPPGSTYQIFGIGTVTALGGINNLFGHQYPYGGYEYDGGDIKRVIFTDSIGLTTDFYGFQYGAVYYHSADVIQAIIYDSAGIPTYFTNHYKPEFNLIPITHIDTCNFNLNFNVMHHYTHLPPGGGPPWITGLDFIDSVWMYSYYSKSDSIIQEQIFYPFRPSVSNFSINKQLDTVLLKDGFTFNYKFEAKDKGIIPEYTNSPDSGYYQCIWDFPNSINSNSDNKFHYLMLQNYPNPFNPTTKIKYQLPEISKVKLTVYDVLGREIKTLVNEEKPAGSYEVEFDGSRLPSGVYFYRIEAGKFSDTKKFILLK